MILTKKTILGIDMGERRMGLAMSDTELRIAQPLTTLTVDGTEVVRLQSLLLEHDIAELVIGLPRNASGQETAQSQWIRDYVDRQIAAFNLPIHFQDESVTSVLAEQQLASHKKNYSKADVDAYAAAIILQDYLDCL
ncbi:MAG TPA: Holliday junction resolvase RuvX [Patescibacteria group bacterium]|jgi:putative Holliday junction resolvase|nr:Holliday junction resolvase RuvX [Patescibacteria group bacterium]